MFSKLVAVVALAIGVAVSLKVAQIPEKFTIPQKPSRFDDKPSAPLSFTWDNCGSASDPISIKALSVAPDPIVLGDNITLSFAASSTKTIVSGKMELTLEKKIWGVWTEIPCIDNVGSCTYGNFCTLIKPEPCKPPFSTYNIPCQCPFPQGTYKLPPSQIKTKDPGLSWLTDGDYYAKVQLYDDNDNELACYEAYATLAPKTSSEA